MNVDNLLHKRGLKLEDLSTEEQETLMVWMSALQRNELSVPAIQSYVTKMRESVSSAITEIDETPNTWLSVLCFFIPIIGIIRKWYLDQRRLLLTARLRNYILLEAMMVSPQRAKQQIEKQINSIKVAGR